jgi:hypothetical protein
MPDPNITRVNQVPYSWVSCAHFFNGIPYKGITAVTFKETREVKLVHAAQQDGLPLGITSGIYKVENVSFTLLRDSAAGLMVDLAALGIDSFGDASFSYMLSVFEPVFPPSAPITTLINGCRITGVEDKQEMGSDELVTEFTVQAMFVVRTIAGAPVNLWSVQRSLLP